MKFGEFFPPMLLKEIEKPFDSSLFLYEIKFDGIRATIHVGPNTFKIFNRRGLDITKLYPELKNIQKYIKKNTIFDGEIVLFDSNKPSFSKLQERSHLKDLNKIIYFSENYPVCFIVFDCLYKDKEMINEPLIKRKQILELEKDNDFFIKTTYVLQKGTQLFKKIKKLDLEGIVAKNIKSKYEINTRSENWLKIKNLKHEKFYIGGFFDDSTQNMVRLYLGEFKNKEFYFVGKVMAGKKRAIYKQLKQQKIIKKSSFINFDEENVLFIKPKLTCDVAYIERTKNNQLRQPVFKK